MGLGKTIPDLFNWGFTEDELQIKNPEKLEATDDGYEEEIPEESPRRNQAKFTISGGID